MTPQEILLAAAEGLEEHDWCQGSNFTDKDDKRWMLDYLDTGRPEPVAACIVGAVCLVGMDDIEARDQAVKRLEQHLATESNPWASIPSWNDKRGRTKGEVIETMRRAARVA